MVISTNEVSMKYKQIYLQKIIIFALILGGNAYLSKYYFISPSHIFFLIAILSFLILIFTKFKNKNFKINKKKYHIAVAIILYSSYTLFISKTNTSILEWMKENIGIIIIIIFILSDSNNISYKKTIFFSIFSLLITSTVDVIYLYNKFSNDLFLGYRNIELMYEIKKSSILYLDTNFTSLSILSLIVLLIENKGVIKNNKITWLLILLSIVYLIFLYSRASIISIIAYLILRKLSNNFLTLALLILSLTCSIFFIFFNKIHLDYSFESKLEIINNLRLYFSAIDFSDIILGGGAGYSSYAFNIIGTDTGSHLLFVTILVNYGIIGFLLYIYMAITLCINRSIRNYLLLLFILSFSMLPIAFPSIFITIGILSKKDE